MADYGQWFAIADVDRDGKVSGAEAVAFFTRAGLTQQSLAQLWQLSDNPARGFLERKQFDIAMQLITVAQVRVRLDIVSRSWLLPARARPNRPASTRPPARIRPCTFQPTRAVSDVLPHPSERRRAAAS